MCACVCLLQLNLINIRHSIIRYCVYGMFNSIQLVNLNVFLTICLKLDFVLGCVRWKESCFFGDLKMPLRTLEQ